LPGTTETNPELAPRAFLLSEMCIQTSDLIFANGTSSAPPNKALRERRRSSGGARFNSFVNADVYGGSGSDGSPPSVRFTGAVWLVQARSVLPRLAKA